MDLESHGRILKELSTFVEQGKIKCHLQQRIHLHLEGLRKGHELIESGKSMGKVALGADVDETKSNEAFS